MKKIILTLVLLVQPFAANGGIQAPMLEHLNLADLTDPDIDYFLNVAATVKPVKIYSSIGISVPVKLKVLCGEQTLSQASFFYNSTLKGTSVKLSVTIQELITKCPTEKPTILIEPNGVELEVSSPFYAYDLVPGGLTFAAIKTLRTDKQKELIKLMTTLSDLGGSKTAFYCLIYDYNLDILTEKLVDAMKSEYQKYYGPWQDETGISCPAEAVGALAKNAAQCEADSLDFSPFCLVYSRYKITREWYYSSIARLNQINAGLDSTLDTLKQEVADFQDSMETEIADKETVLSKKMTGSL